MNRTPAPAALRSTLRRTLAGLLMATGLLAAAPGFASEAQLVITPASYGAHRAVEIEINKSMLVDLPACVAEVIVSQPAIAAGIMRTRTRAILQGLNPGTTNIIFLDDAGRTMSVLDVKVTQSASEAGMALEATLARVIPGSSIRVESIGETGLSGETRYVLTGSVLTAADKAAAEAVAAVEPGSSLINVIGPQQVMLQVTVSEVQRDIAKQFGINLSGALSVGNVNLSFNNTVTPLGGLNTSNGLNATGLNIGNLDINAAIRALETRGGLRVLAQPTLTAISGQEANFLAGGEIPYATTDGQGNQTVVFRPYGVELSFTPVVKSNGLVALTVNTSVSEPQSSGSLTKRQANTSVELPAGTTLAIGGLLQESTRQQIDQLPGLGHPDPRRAVPLAGFPDPADRAGDPRDAVPRQSEPRRHHSRAHRCLGRRQRCRGDIPRQDREDLRRCRQRQHARDLQRFHRLRSRLVICGRRAARSY